MEVNELVEKIRSWEQDAGESFNDYFSHDNILNTSWAFWLIGKGFKEHGNQIIATHLKNDGYVDQEELYNIHHDDSDWNEEDYEKDVALLAEFLLATPYYTDKVNKFFNEKEEA